MGLTLLHDLTLLVDHLGEVSLTHRLGLPIRILEVLTSALEDLAELHRDRCRGCDLVLRGGGVSGTSEGGGRGGTHVAVELCDLGVVDAVDGVVASGCRGDEEVESVVALLLKKVSSSVQSPPRTKSSTK